MIDFLQGLFFPIEHTPKKKKLTDLEKYILSHKPDSLAEVERLTKIYQNENNGPYNYYHNPSHF